jgi:hypothetical protein
MSDGSEVFYKFDKDGSKLDFFLPGKKAMTGNQKKQFISDLLGDSKKGFDLNKYLVETEPKKKSAQLAQLVGLDFTAINQELNKAVEERQMKGRDYEASKARAVFDVPLATIKANSEAEVPNTAQIQAAIEIRLKANADKERAQKEYDSIFDRKNSYMAGVSDLQKQVFEKEDQIRMLREGIEVLNSRIKTGEEMVREEEAKITPAFELLQKMPIYTEEQIQQYRNQLDKIGEIQSAKIQASEMLKKIDEVEENKKIWEEKDEAVKAIEARKNKMIQGCNNIIPGLTFDASLNAIYNGRPIDEASTGEQVRFAVAIKKREQEQGLHFMHIDAHALDGKNIKLLSEDFAKEGWTVLLEIPEQNPNAESGLKIEVVERI